MSTTTLTKPKTPITILLIMSIIVLIDIMPSIVLHGIWDYIGANNTDKISIDTTCSVLYVTTKFGNGNTNKIVFVAFLAVCMAFVITAAIVGMLAMLLFKVIMTKETEVGQHFLIVTTCKVYTLYCLASLDILCIAVNLGYFLMFYIEIPTSCRTIDLSLQYIILFCLSAFMLLMMLLVWLGVVMLARLLKEFQTDNQIDDTPLLAKDVENNKIKQIQMRKYLDQEKEQLQSARKSLLNKQQYEGNQRQSMTGYLHPARIYVASDLKDRRRDEDIHYSAYHRSDLHYQNNQETEIRKSQVQSLIHSRHHEQKSHERVSYIEESRKVYESREIEGNAHVRGQEYSHRQPSQRLQESHFRDDKGRHSRYQYEQPRRTSPKHSHRYQGNHRSQSRNGKSPSRQRKGMLLDYIQGKYVD